MAPRLAHPDTSAAGGVPAGVMAWRPPAAMVRELSALFHTGPSDTGPSDTGSDTGSRFGPG